jgi:hypothetical protein
MFLYISPFQIVPIFNININQLLPSFVAYSQILQNIRSTHYWKNITYLGPDVVPNHKIRENVGKVPHAPYAPRKKIL